MREIKVQTPAKINLTLEILNRREDGFHNLQSIMQAVSLYDYLTITVEDSSVLENEIKLSGTSREIPYDNKNIVYKAVKLYLEAAGISNKKISINIEKNIPVAAGLAGGSTNASGAFYGLNEIFEHRLKWAEIHSLASQLGSDLNFCLDGGCALCTGRGEKIEKLFSANFELLLIKPKGFGISAKEAYQKFALLADKSIPNNTQKLKKLLDAEKFDESLIYNSLEKAILPDYEVLKYLKTQIPNSLMSGSGPTFFVIGQSEDVQLDREKFDIFKGLSSVNFGVKAV